jgi:hypothetical protein
MLDRDLAALYQVSTRVFNQAVSATATDFPRVLCSNLTMMRPRL